MATDRILLERTTADGIEAGIQPRERWQQRRLGGDLEAQRRERVSDERPLTAHQLIQDDAERPEIAAMIDILGRTHVLRGHVARRAHEVLGARHAGITRRRRALADAEIKDLDRSSAV